VGRPHLAYGLSAGGSEQADLYLLNLASGRHWASPCRACYDGLNWLPDSRSFTFTQLAAMAPGESETETYMDARVMWLRWAPRQRPVFGPTVTRALGLDRLDVGETHHRARQPLGGGAHHRHHGARRQALRGAAGAIWGKPGTPWRRLATEADKVVQVALQGDALYVMTQAGTPRRKVVKVDLAPGPG
jgi:prolyl oligopeptidase